MTIKKHILINGSKHILYPQKNYSEQEMLNKSKSFYDWMDERRSIREFSDQPVSKKVIENIIQTASTAPSGAHKQPWTFCAVSNPLLKTEIRQEAEKEEQESYSGRMSERWINDLRPFATFYCLSLILG